jgi:peptidoglycan-associated lipoprotein
VTVKMKVLLLAGSLVLVASGCAKQGVLNKDDSLASGAAATARYAEPRGTVDRAATAAPLRAVAEGDIVAEAGKPGAPSGEALAAETLKNSLESVYFNFDSAQLSEAARNALVKDAQLMQILGNGTIRVEGNCDERGSDEYNLALGDQRARAAVRYLVSLGVPASRLSWVSFGKEKPALPGHDEESLAKNRRDDFVVVQ